MSKSLVISIDNKDYSVIGEDEDLIKKSAELLNEKINEVVSNIKGVGNITSLTKTTLAALNIADMKITNEIKHNAEMQSIAGEINQISTYIMNNLSNSKFM
jgi:cell division protein ZapA (FtsZ GTPase activity inhibitor)